MGGPPIFRMLGEESKEERRYPDRVLIARLLKMAVSYRLYFASLVVVMLLRIGLNMLNPYVVRNLIDSVVALNFDSLKSWSLAFLGIALAGWLAGYVNMYATSYLGSRIMFELREKMYRHLYRVQLQHVSKEPVGRIVSRFTNDIDTLGNVATSGFLDIVGDVLTISGAIVFMWVLSPQLSLVCYTLIPLMAAVNYILIRRSREAYRLTRQKIAEVTSRISQDVSGADVVQSFSFRRRRNIEEFRRINEENLRANVQATAITSAMNPATSIIQAIGIAIILGYGGSLVVQGALTLGTLVAFFNYLDMFFRPIRMLVMFFTVLQSTLAAAERVFSFLDSEPEADEGDLEEPPRVGSVEFRNVVFGYEEGSPVINNVSFRVEPGEMVAIVGPTGAGKSTLASLLLRFYEPWEGEILVDGVDYRRYKLSALRSAMVMVPQEPVLLSGTVMDNILVTNPKATKEDVEEAVRLLGLEEFYRTLPDGLDTVILEGGKNLSVGQRQVISLLRALLANPRILVLDEATSSVDPYTEAKLQAAIEKLVENRTTIVIAHRLQTVINADRIVVLDNGRVVEEGTHNELLNRGGLYAKLYGMQLGIPAR